jgi:hypothetical protein
MREKMSETALRAMSGYKKMDSVGRNAANRVLLSFTIAISLLIPDIR